MLRGAGFAGAYEGELLLELPTLNVQERVARFLNKTAPAPRPAMSSTAIITPIGDDPEVDPALVLSDADADCCLAVVAPFRGSGVLGSGVLGSDSGCEVTVEAGAGSELGLGAAGFVAEGLGIAEGLGVAWPATAGLGTAGLGTTWFAAAGFGSTGIGATAWFGLAAATDGAESQPPATETDAVMPGSAAGGDTRGAGASESVRFSENDHPCTVPGRGEMFPAPKVL